MGDKKTGRNFAFIQTIRTQINAGFPAGKTVSGINAVGNKIYDGRNQRFNDIFEFVDKSKRLCSHNRIYLIVARRSVL
jgi:hypothetical protein